MNENNNIKTILRHVVLFKFCDQTEESIVKEIEMRFVDLKDQIDIVKALEYGTDVSREGLSHGYTHCFILSFRSEQDRDAYIIHMAHQAFITFIKPHLESVCVVDYWI